MLIESEHPAIVVEERAEMWLLYERLEDPAETTYLESGGKGKTPIKFNANFPAAAP